MSNRILKFLPPDDATEAICRKVAADLDQMGHALNHVAPEVLIHVLQDPCFKPAAGPLEALVMLSRARSRFQLLFELAEDLEDELALAAAGRLAPGETFHHLDWRVERVGDRLVAAPVETPPKTSADMLERMIVRMTAAFRQLAASGHLPPENGAGPVDPPPPG